MTTYGFIGLGQIGGPMAKRCPDALVYDVRPEATAGFDNVASSVAEVGERCDVISVVVRDEKEVRDVLSSLTHSGRVVAVHSTIAPTTPEELDCEADGFDVVDAPVSGGAIGAHDGTLVVMVGGPADVVDRCREPFSAWSSMFVHAGGVGAGTTMKIARNLITFASFVAASEAQRLAEAAGIDLATLGNVVRHSDKVTGGPGAIMFRETTAPVDASDVWHDVLVHTADLGEKELALALVLGEELGVDLPMTKLALERFAKGLGVRR
jgi:3-hydroxyisobutyrate dehydrogenase-like beta-hydroxyacid dehydrogenase